MLPNKVRSGPESKGKRFGYGSGSGNRIRILGSAKLPEMIDISEFFLCWDERFLDYSVLGLLNHFVCLVTSCLHI